MTYLYNVQIYSLRTDQTKNGWESFAKKQQLKTECKTWLFEQEVSARGKHCVTRRVVSQDTTTKGTPIQNLALGMCR